MVIKPEHGPERTQHSAEHKNVLVFVCLWVCLVWGFVGLVLFALLVLGGDFLFCFCGDRHVLSSEKNTTQSSTSNVRMSLQQISKG